jgi:hypothetical protein
MEIGWLKIDYENRPKFTLNILILNIILLHIIPKNNSLFHMFLKTYKV